MSKQKSQEINKLEVKSNVAKDEVIEEHNLNLEKKLDTYTEEDSGFISGPQMSYDSDYINQLESEVINAEKSKNTLNLEEPLESMGQDSGIDSGLTERLHSLSIKNQQGAINNLNVNKNDSKKLSDDNHTSITTNNDGVFQQSERKLKQPWEICYQQNSEGDTQLHIACITGFSEVVCALIRLAPHPCLLDIYNDNVESALHLAVLTSRPEIIRLLLAAGASVNVRDSNGNTPLHLACFSGDLECVKALVVPIAPQEIKKICKTRNPINYSKCGKILPDLEIRNYEGERCVHLATRGNHVDILRLLVWFGVDINAREGKSGKTPLHIAIEKRNCSLIRFFFEECNELEAETVTYSGLTAYQQAAIEKDQDILDNLKNFGVETLSPPESDEESDFDDELYHPLANETLIPTYNGAVYCQ